MMRFWPFKRRKSPVIVGRVTHVTTDPLGVTFQLNDSPEAQRLRDLINGLDS